MEEDYIGFELAVLAKQKGFNEYCDRHFCYGNGDKTIPKDNELFTTIFLDENGNPRKYRNSELANWELPYGEFTAPTQFFLAKWLREKCNINVQPYLIECKFNERLVEQKLEDKEYAYRIYQNGIDVYCDAQLGLNHKQAFEEGLIIGLNLI